MEHYNLHFNAQFKSLLEVKESVEFSYWFNQFIISSIAAPQLKSESQKTERHLIQKKLRTLTLDRILHD